MKAESVRPRSTLQKLVAEVPLLIPYVLTRLVPRDRNVWVFGAWFGNRYADNSRYVFEHVCEHEPGIRAVWVSRRPDIVEDLRRAGREAYLAQSWKGFWMCCRASLVFVNCGLQDVNRGGALRAKKVQLWHGIPLKKIKLDDEVTENPVRSNLYRALRWVWRRLLPYVVDRWDLIASTSSVESERLQTAFGAELSQVKVTGDPRGDIILDPEPDPVPVVEALKSRWNAKKVVCYLPTHRGGGLSEFDLLSDLDVDELQDCLERLGAVMFIKMHYFHRNSRPMLANTGDESRIRWLAEEELSDVNRMLPHIDVLITDYSSVYLDYLLLNRPVIFAPFDRDRYLATDREFYEAYDAATPGPKCATWHEVIAELPKCLNGHDGYDGVRQSLRQRYHAHMDTANCRRVVEAAKELLADQFS